MIKIIISLSSIAFFIVSASVDCNAFRCGGGFISVGDSKAKALLECGKPTSKEKGGAKKVRRSKKDERDRDGRRAADKNAFKERTKSVEKWYYNCGDNDFIYILTFEGGILKSEETGGYGKGKSDCKGK